MLEGTSKKKIYNANNKRNKTIMQEYIDFQQSFMTKMKFRIKERQYVLNGEKVINYQKIKMFQFPI